MACIILSVAFVPVSCVAPSCTYFLSFSLVSRLLCMQQCIMVYCIPMCLLFMHFSLQYPPVAYHQLFTLRGPDVAYRYSETSILTYMGVLY